jgi:acyl-coenzyme A synthetase/AMP-(fatty) acid ligase
MTGVNQGVRTVLMVPPGIDFFILTFALFKVGAIPVVVDPGMGARRLVQCLQHSQPGAFIGVPRAQVARLFFRRQLGKIEHCITVGRKWLWGGHRLDELRLKPWRTYPIQPIHDKQPAAILFTTGSTGPAKGVVYTHTMFDAQIRAIREQFAIGDDEIDLPTFPLFALFDPALGMTAIIPDMDPTRPAKANQARICQAIVDHGVTNMFASPALLKRLGSWGVNHGIRLPSLRRVVSAGAPVSPEAIEIFLPLLSSDARIHTPYGATEAMPITTIDNKEILNETRAQSEHGFGFCVGRPVEGLELCTIAIDDGPITDWSAARPLPAGEVGEIVVKGDQVARHYFNNDEADQLHKIVDDERFWHRMGDLGWIDNKGRLWFCGRKSQRVRTARDTLYTIPCESIFNKHPAVSRSALVGIGRPPDQRPVICIELDGRRHGDTDGIKTDLLEMARSHPMTEQIETVLFHDAFPVDIRHNAKIFREQLSLWAERKLGTS